MEHAGSVQNGYNCSIDPFSPVDLVTFFFPMWNEEDTIHRTIAAGHEAGRLLVERGETVEYELLLIDDASTDRTGILADEAAAADPHVRVVHHAHNRGLGGGIQTGLAEARGDLILYTDADLPFDLVDAEKAARLLRIYEADIVSAYRLDRTGEGPVRLAYSYVYNQLVQLAFGLRVRDVNFAFKLLRRSVLDDIELTSDGSFIDVELLVKAQRAGHHIVQFGVDYFPRTRGVSTLSSPAVIRRILVEGARLYPELRRTRRHA